MGLGNRGVIGDKWSSRILWLAAIGSAIASAFILFLSIAFLGFYMVAVERQTQNREKMMAESMRAAGSSADGGE